MFAGPPGRTHPKVWVPSHRFGRIARGGIQWMMSFMQRGAIVKQRSGPDIRKRIITLIFDGTSGPMRFEGARTDLTARVRQPRRNDRSRVSASR